MNEQPGGTSIEDHLHTLAGSLFHDDVDRIDRVLPTTTAPASIVVMIFPTLLF